MDPEFSSLELSLGNGASFQPFQLKGLASDGTFLSDGESLQIHLTTPASESVMGSKGFKAVYWTRKFICTSINSFLTNNGEKKNSSSIAQKQIISMRDIYLPESCNLKINKLK